MRGLVGDGEEDIASESLIALWLDGRKLFDVLGMPIARRSWGNRDNLTPNPFPYGKGDNRACGRSIREVCVIDAGRWNDRRDPSLRSG